MAVGNTPTVLAADTEESILTFAKRAQELMHSQWSIRPTLENIDKYYMMEGNRGDDDNTSRVLNRLGDKSKFRDVVVPVVMPQVEAALGYYMTVFLSGNPIFEVSGPPQYEDAALQINSLIANQERKAKWAQQLILFWRDGLKYNLHGIECDWKQQASYQIDNNGAVLEGKPKQILWSGNVLKRMDMYNTFFDPRVTVSEVHEKGEFAGFVELYSRIAMKKFINELYGKIPAATAIKAFESGYAGVTPGSGYLGFYVPQINPEALKSTIPGQFDWSAWFIGDSGSSTGKSANPIAYKNMYLVTKLYARIIPADFGIRCPGANTPQVWKFYLINNQVVLYAERLTNAHNFIPIIFGQPIEDGLNYQTKSFSQNVMPLQDTASAFWNSAIASKRRLTHDRTYYDPSRIRSADINNPNPAAKIPVRPSAYGKNPGEAIYVSPYRDDLSQNLVGEADMLSRFADKINGQNASTQGQFTKGNRTLHEYQDVVGHSNTRNQALCVMTELQVHTPLKEMILINNLQYPGPDEVLTPDGKDTVKIDLAKLREAVVEMTVSDGLEPVDKNMNTEEYISMMQVIGSTPALQGGYNLPPLFSYIAKLRGADLEQFEKTPVEMQYDQQLAAWQQAAQQAAMKGAAFSTPMPQAPTQQQIQQAQQQAQATQQSAIQNLVGTGNPQQQAQQAPAAGGNGGMPLGMAMQQPQTGAQ